MFLARGSLEAQLTNLITQGDFETAVVTAPGVSDGQFFTDAQFDNPGDENWISSTGNNYELWQQGFLGSPTLGSDGLPTGQHLEVRGQNSNGSVTISVVIPVGVLPGSEATLQYDAWMRTTLPVPQIRVRRNGGILAGLNNATITANNASWTQNTHIFTVSPGDTINIRFRNNTNNSTQSGLHLDDVQLLVTIIPEPGHVGAMLGAALLFSFLCRRSVSVHGLLIEGMFKKP
ncbi:MAG: PEP-CTERM sorting domain-containing protein [Candidatus Methylacidiphilales bacterium]